jgi:hypothetical protein
MTLKLKHIACNLFVVKNVYLAGPLVRISGQFRYGKLDSRWFTVRGIKRSLPVSFCERWNIL